MGILIDADQKRKLARPQLLRLCGGDDETDDQAEPDEVAEHDGFSIAKQVCAGLSMIPRQRRSV
jgi:hypothetical protein